VTDALPIADAHQHFWDPAGGRYPWLSSRPLATFRYGDYSPMRRGYFPEDFRRDAATHRVVATVHMEAEWDTDDEVGETRWLALRKEHGLPTVAVGHARFESPEIDEVLAGHAAFDFVRGIRQKPAASGAPADAWRGAPGSMDDPAWRRGYALLERHRLHFDVQTPWWHLDALADLARDFPRIAVVINHRAPGRPQRRRAGRLAPRTGDRRGSAKRRAEDLRARPARQNPSWPTARRSSSAGSSTTTPCGSTGSSRFSAWMTVCSRGI